MALGRPNVNIEPSMCWAVAFYGCVPLYPFELQTHRKPRVRIFLKKPVDQIQENFFVIALGTCRHVAYKSAQVCMHKLKDFLNKSINNADTYTYPKFVECFLISVSHSLFSLWTWPWQALSHPLGASVFL